MKGILISVRDHNEFKFISELIKKLEIASAIVSKEEMEDLGLSVALKSVDKTKRISREKVMKKLSD